MRKQSRKLNVLFAGEQVTAIAHEIKGFDSFEACAYKEDGGALYEALTRNGIEVTWLRTAQVPIEFPETPQALRRYDVVILSDVGANSLLFHPEVLAKSVPHPNRLKLLRDYVRQGGGVLMVGGWMSFAGIGGKAKYYHSPLEEALPVTCLPYDDRQEVPEGVTPVVKKRDHPVLRGVPMQWPFFLGYNKVVPKEGSEVLVTVGEDPLLCVWSYGKGRSAAFTSDCAPHWGPPGFLSWTGYARLWTRLVQWLGRWDDSTEKGPA